MGVRTALFGALMTTLGLTGAPIMAQESQSIMIAAKARTIGDVSGVAQDAATVRPLRGIYVTATSMALPRFETLLKNLKAAGGNLIVFDAKDEGGIVSYPSEVALALTVKASAAGPLRDLKARVQLAHRYGIQVAGRVVCFHDPIVAQKLPSLAARSVKGGPWKELGRQSWLDPSLPACQDYNIDLAKELVKAGVDEVQFDYIRFPAMGDTQNARYAFDVSRTPKHAIITAFLKRAYETLHPLGMRVSIDVYGIMAWAMDIDVRITGQRLSDLARHTDVICPMLYPSHFNDGFAGIARPANAPYQFMFKGLTLLNERVAGTSVVVRPWMQAMPYKVSRFDARYIVEQLRAGSDARATGYMMWNAHNRYDVAFAGMRAYHAAR
jgi:hypothetical protein